MWIVLVRAPSFTSSTSIVAGPANVRRRKESCREIGEAGVEYLFGWAWAKWTRANRYRTEVVYPP